MFNLKANFLIILILILIVCNFISFDCIKAQSNNPTSESDIKNTSSKNLYSKEKAMEILTEKYKMTREFESLDYKKELKLIYSLAMYCDSTFTILYQPTYFKENGGVWFHADINSAEWKTVKNEIIDIYKRIGTVPCESATNTNSINANYEVKYQLIEKIPSLFFYSTSYKFLEEVSKLDGKILSIACNYENIAAEVINTFHGAEIYPVDR